MERQNFIERLKTTKGIVWDLDNTLYRLDEALMQAFHIGVARAALDAGVALDLAEATSLAQKSFAEFGYSGRVFVDKYGVDDVWLHHKFHHYVDEKMVERSAALIALFEQANLQHAIITHGSGHWARRVLEHLGLKKWFPDDRILALEDYDFKKKSESPASFMQATDRLDIEADDLLFVEDTQRNLAVAYELGFGTVLVHNGKRPEPMARFVDADYNNALELLQHIMQQKTTARPDAVSIR